MTTNLPPGVLTQVEVRDGITLRDHFAEVALDRMIERALSDDEWLSLIADHNIAGVARDAYIVADAMLAARLPEDPDFHVKEDAPEGMEPHHAQAIDDEAEIRERLGKLQKFMDGPIYPMLGDDEKGLLRGQLNAMVDCRRILVRRIGAFAGEEAGS